MTEQDKERLVTYWENGMSLRQIQQLLPYTQRKFWLAVSEMKANGTFPKERLSRQEKVAEAVRGGELNPYILAEQFGISVGTAKEYKRIYGGVAPKVRPKLNYRHCDRTKAIMQDLQEGELSLSEIARNHGVTRQAVFSIKKKLIKINEEISNVEK